MMRSLCVLFVATRLVFGQQQPELKPSFDVASVKPSVSVGPWNPPMKTANRARITYRDYPLRRLIAEAYGVGDYQIQGPAWLARERYDIIANKPRDATASQILPMMQSLLTQRFHLVTHLEKKEMPAYVLLPGKDTFKLRPAKDATDVPGCQSFGTLSEFADMLARNLDSPVVDQTGIPGTFYFILTWASVTSQREQIPGMPLPPPPPPNPPPCPGWSAATMPPAADSIFSAVKEQMGLRLERRGKAQVEVLVIDRSDKAPEKN
jgi:uncharacterized protein (TIGR03435 family)